MNIEQLERIRTLIASIRTEVSTDIMGINQSSHVVDELTETVTEELKNTVWKQYLESEES